MTVLPDEETDVSEHQAGKVPGRWTVKWTAGIGVAVLLFAGGAVAGYSMPDPKTSAAYVALDKEKSAAEQDRDSARADHGRVNVLYSALLKGVPDREAKVTARETVVGAGEAALKDAQAAVKKREDAVAGVEKQKAANTFRDGTWVVGTDIEPGTYRAAAAVQSGCYWGIYQSGSNGSQIIENDVPGGGRPSVLLAAGQDFKSSRCGSWEKQ
ncbi:hypothetical protein [Paenarthrobacter sp. PH39-S1]|uniref:hypothetical protein n=1 Tax=Paenarthrobacter sp. PH39-S1 TaxID=3046204 RepID=UPI0024BAF6C3|nr:hypothetical protein [Paenarthrobacter sp. PH39-S1]MDJ0355465.1 hypothetical protein [Paenarthrobacter sp. PH39-S1]